jgi:hypothetical protein
MNKTPGRSRSNPPRRPRSQQTLKNQFPSPMSLGEDGVDHINIWERAKTSLGKALAINVKMPFKHNLFLGFYCLEALADYIASNENSDLLRTMYGQPMRDYYTEKCTRRRVTNYKAIMIEAYWQQIQQHPQKLLKPLKDSNLWIDCYYVSSRDPNQLRQRPPYAQWVIPGLRKIRAALQAGTPLDLSDILDDPAMDFFTCVFPHRATSPSVSEDLSDSQRLEEYLSQEYPTEAPKEAPGTTVLTFDAAPAPELILPAGGEPLLLNQG